VARNNACGQQF